MPMKLSIITIVKNGKDIIEKTIQSVVSQTCKDFEYIVIDGASDDGTYDVIKKYSDRITHLISEKDNGIGDAFNKGIKCASGDWILFLNAGDYFFENNVLQKMVPVLDRQDKTVDIVYGKVLYINSSNKVLKVAGNKNYKKLIKWEMPFPHQATFQRRTLFDIYGLFDTSYKIAVDYEFMIRIPNIKAVFVPVVVSNMLAGGVSMSNTTSALNESRRAHFCHYRDSSLSIWMHYTFIQLRIRVMFALRKLFGKRLDVA